jgi:AcrR family transcriptional regulator
MTPRMAKAPPISPHRFPFGGRSKGVDRKTRPDSLEATRERIVEAAIAHYTELGISAATMREIARRADVAPGTLRNHFRTREDLVRAMVERLIGEAPLPELSIFDGADSFEERFGRLISVTAGFFDQSSRLHRTWLREQMLTPVRTETGAAYGRRWEQLLRAAVGPLADDPVAMSVIRAVLEEGEAGGTRLQAMTWVSGSPRGQEVPPTRSETSATSRWTLRLALVCDSRSIQRRSTRRPMGSVYSVSRVELRRAIASGQRGHLAIRAEQPDPRFRAPAPARRTASPARPIEHSSVDRLLIRSPARRQLRRRGWSRASTARCWRPRSTIAEVASVLRGA